MADKNLRLIWNTRWFDAAVLTSVSEASGYPVSCLQDPFRSRKHRTTSITGQAWTVDFGVPRPFNTVAFIDHNLSTGGSFRLMASNSFGGSDLWDETYDAWLPIIGFGEDRFGDWGFGGTLLESDRSWFAPKPIRIIYLEDENEEQQSVLAKYLRIEPTDASNPDAFFEIGNLFPVQFADFGITFSSIVHGTVDDSEINRSLGGQAWVTKNVPKRKTIALTLDTLLYGDKYWNLKFMVEKMGLTNNFIIDCFPSNDKASQNYHSILYGRFQDMPEITQSFDMGFAADIGGNGLQVSSTEITFQEEIV